ncbi:MAG: hypothetical protein HOH14_13040 [Gammaproteobacteria bacterium]|nr:hypothetical protein [Gammaproteobacteria bacterium]
MLNFFNKNKISSGLVGLSISAENITLAHVMETNDGPKLLLCKDFPITNDEEKASILAEQVRKLGLENINASYVLSSDEYKLLLVEAPDVGANEIADAVKWKIKDLLDNPVEEMAITVFPVPDDAYRGQTKMVYVVAALKSKIREIVELVTGADLFTGNVVTPNFGNETITPTVTISHSVALPLTSTLGVLTAPVYDDFVNGEQLRSDIVYSEVGILDLQANLVGGYLNDTINIEGTVKNVGRFTPHHYTYTLVPPHQDRGALGAACLQPSTFTYMGEDIGFAFDMEARNLAEAITRNYHTGFDRLNANNELIFTALDTVSEDILTSRLANPTLTFSWGNSPVSDTGEATISGTIIMQKDSAPDGPYNNFTIGIVPMDDDGITILPADLNLDGDLDTSDDTYQIFSTSIRYGRLAINNAAGSEISINTLLEGAGADIPITIEVEYFDSASGNFINNGIDDCTPFDSQYLTVVTASYTEGLTADMSGVGTPTLGVNVVPLTGTIGVLDNGRTSPNSEDGIDPDPPMYLSSPFSADDVNPLTGSVVIELDLDALGLEFLKFNWYGIDSTNPYDDTPDGGNVEDNPRAIVDFGQIQGHNRIINWQELIPVQ